MIGIVIVIILMETWADEGRAQSGPGRHLSICRPGRPSPIRLKFTRLYHDHSIYKVMICYNEDHYDNGENSQLENTDLLVIW